MKRRRFFLFGAILAGIAMAGLAPPARADFEVQFSFGGATITVDDTTGVATASGGASLNGAQINGTSVSGTSASFTKVGGKLSIFGLTVDPSGTSDGNTGGFNISATVSKSNSPGTLNVAAITLSSLAIFNQTGVSGTSTVNLLAGDTGFTAPSSGIPLGTLTSMSGTADPFNGSGLPGSGGTLVLNSYVDTTNSQFGTQQHVGMITLNIPAGGSQSGNVTGTANTNPTPYSLTLALAATVANNNDISDGSSSLQLTAPEPSSMALAGFGAFSMLLYARKRRKAAAAA